MAKVLVVTSGKAASARRRPPPPGARPRASGQKVAVVDFDVGLRNLDL